jgi:hypothetical protein
MGQSWIILRPPLAQQLDVVFYDKIQYFQLLNSILVFFAGDRNSARSLTEEPEGRYSRRGGFKEVKSAIDALNLRLPCRGRWFRRNNSHFDIRPSMDIFQTPRIPLPPA